MSEHTPAPTPSRGVYGFALYLTCVCSFGLYVVWAAVPDSVLHWFGITYYPQVCFATKISFKPSFNFLFCFQKYWAIALPIYCLMGLALFAFFVYPSLNLMLTPPLDSMNTITDSHSIYKEVHLSVKNKGSGDNPDVQGIPPLSDIHISKVCKSLYLKK